MRTLPPALAAALAGDITTLCQAWLLTRRDGLALGFTDHDEALIIAGQLFAPALGFEASAAASGAGLAIGGGEIRGIIDSPALTDEALLAGLFDGAELRRYRVDWARPTLDFLEDVTILGEIRRIDSRFEAETRQPFVALDEERGRRYTRACTAAFGDARCGLDREAPPFRQVVTIAEASPAALRCPALAHAPTGLFTRGVIRRLTGPLAGAEAAIRDHAPGGWLLLWQAWPAFPARGERVVVLAGCDKHFLTCRDRFDNAENFRGFPHIPAPERILAYARPGEGRHQGRPLVQP